MASIGKLYSYLGIDTVNCTILLFWSDKLINAADVKLEQLKFAILFAIDDMCWVKN